MTWQLCIQYPDGQRRSLRLYNNRERALRQVDAIYAQGYPLHVAYLVCPLLEDECDTPAADTLLQLASH
ncbi:MAG TPA: family 2 glycosyl transferase [Leptolyngbyaceae cyanobacterium M33_DOE_097]|uniref:Family 2 glycosyl transferase n=1 Tax=Oscillatoriales cyanobacterium SpSt-418 TaxID=2282169 RepID=A0A7C3PGI0_9CYAN|nr:family 2 glycosyl transferase [Leptolyngbyaceae cyanobacterium M33_DOE_097]